MGRPKDLSTKFSAIDTDYSQKGLSIKIRLKFKMLGHLTLFEVLNWINSGKGCYAECEDMTDTAVAFAITRLGSIDYAGDVEDIFRYMIEIGFFDKNAYGRDKILTSKGIVKRWIEAKSKSDPASFDLPESVREMVEEIISSPEKCTKHIETPISSPEKCTKRAEIPQEKRSTNKQTNKKSAEISADVSQAEFQPDLIAEARRHPRWAEVRLKMARTIYGPGLSADLVDLYTVAGLHAWITPRQLARWRREAESKIELYENSNGRAGKAKLWEVLRPPLEEVFASQGLVLPRCDPSRREPPPVPLETRGLEPAVAAAQAVKI